MKNLINEIEKHVNARIKNIEESLEKESLQLVNGAKEEADSAYKKIIKEGGEKIDKAMNGKIEKARSEINNEMLGEQKEIIDRFFDFIFVELHQFVLGKRKIGKKSYKQFLKVCLKRAGKEISGKKVIYCSERDMKTLKTMARGSKIIKSAVRGGILVEDAKKTKRMDFTFSKLVEFRRKLILEKLGVILEK